MKSLTAFAALFLLVSLALPVVAAEPKLLGTYKDWDAFQLGSGSSKQCYIVSQPKTKAPAGVNHGKVYIMVAHKPARKVRGEVNVIAGYTFKANSSVSAVIGSLNEKMFTSGKEAWTYDTGGDKRLVNGMKKGSNLRVRGASARGTNTSYLFSLSGFTAAYNRISQACG